MITPAGRDNTGRPDPERTNAREARRRLENERTLRAGQLAAIEKAPRYATDELMLALLSTTRRTVEEVDAALRRMDEGTYGLCQGCGATIPARRLGILPQTRFCAPCQRQDGER
jgi:RNA polymerase-binding transcription factor DksA